MRLRPLPMILPLVLFLPSCRKSSDRNLVVAAPTALAGAPQVAGPAIRLSGAIKARWTRMKVGVIDMVARQENDYILEADRDFTVPGGDLTIRPLVLVPDFTLDNGVITSRSDEPRNPAARVLITENGREIYRGWLFARFPEAHAFEHPRYAVRLLDLEKASSLVQGAPASEVAPPASR